MAEPRGRVPRVKLTNGVLVPQLGFGTSTIEPDLTPTVVSQALDAGYRHFDTAAAYPNERELGQALKASGLAREQLFVASKLRNLDQGYQSCLTAFDSSRRALDLDVIDLYLIHGPARGEALYSETWRAFEKLYSDGHVRAIGVSNFLPQHVSRLMKYADLCPMTNQIELHPSFQQTDTQNATRLIDAGIVSFAPLGHGRDLDLPAVVEAANRHGVSPAQVILRWQMQLGNIAIPKASTLYHIHSNIDLFTFELTPAEVAEISALDGGERQFFVPDD